MSIGDEFTQARDQLFALNDRVDRLTQTAERLERTISEQGPRVAQGIQQGGQGVGQFGVQAPRIADGIQQGGQGLQQVGQGLPGFTRAVRGVGTQIGTAGQGVQGAVLNAQSRAGRVLRNGAIVVGVGGATVGLFALAHYVMKPAGGARR